MTSSIATATKEAAAAADNVAVWPPAGAVWLVPVGPHHSNTTVIHREDLRLLVTKTTNLNTALYLVHAATRLSAPALVDDRKETSHTKTVCLRKINKSS
ncbi:hypothetical protein RRG08_024858 [Elysia crispata]|uniref:Uncharacterized protein n=1 Tax=Elysia crispata TaxID=231223 RepID=A0AAE1CZS5_9GAST|nr:hypothetical protein RRG08_024858 [Elysia crispata]